MNALDINSFGSEFANKVRQLIPTGFTVEDLIVLPTGLTLIPNDKNLAQGFRPIGCPMCIDGKIGQDKEGYPTINNVRLLTPEEAGQDITGIPPELLSNLWLCPNCKTPVNSLLPQFDLTAL
jgi:hypothetical protein